MAVAMVAATPKRSATATARLLDPRITQGGTGSHLIRQSDGRSDHREAGEAQWAVPQPGRLPTGEHPARRRRLINDGSQRIGQQDRAQSRRLLGPHRIESERSVPLGLLPGAHPQHRQSEKPMQQPGIRGHRTNPVARQRENLALQDPGPQLQLAGPDAVGRGEPARYADAHHQCDHGEHHQRVAGGRTQHHRPDDHRDLPQHLVHRMHEQHAGAEPVPVLR